MSLDPEVAVLLDDMNAQGLPPFEQMTVDQVREDEIAAEILSAVRSPAGTPA